MAAKSTMIRWGHKKEVRSFNNLSVTGLAADIENSTKEKKVKKLSWREFLNGVFRLFFEEPKMMVSVSPEKPQQEYRKEEKMSEVEVWSMFNQSM